MQTIADRQDFVYHELGREVTAIGGHYVFAKEIRLPYIGREFYSLISEAFARAGKYI